MASSTSMMATATKTTTPTATSAPKLAGILDGLNPAEYHASNPLELFIIQAVIIILTCRLLHWPLSRLRQPRVIAEVLGGIVLGPTVMGHVPGFTQHIFPPESKPLLSLVANLGLVLFLFLVGLEVDIRMLIANLKIALSVGAAGMMLPFGLGAAIAYGLYNQFGTDPGTRDVGFGVFVLFIGVAMAITAFPVLARILTELKLLQTDVGIIVLSAGVGNDVVGWILLALTVALVNAGSGVTAVYVLLISVGWVLFLIYAVRPVFVWVVRRSGSLDNGPTQAMVALTLILVLASAFFTDIIGVHAIFGGFLVGLICPHEGGFAIKLTEKIEDLVGVLFLPLYFALSGLNTNIGLLNDGIVWAYVIGVIAVAFCAKIGGGTIAARLNGLIWRESFTIGVLMSCKGLVELIVLNIGLSAGIISQRVFTMFVVMALVTTFATTPLTKALYPPEYQKKLAAWKRGEINWDGTPLHPPSDDESGSDNLTKKGDTVSFKINKMTMLLRLESLPSLFAILNLLGKNSDPVVPRVHRDKLRELEDVAEESSRPNTPAVVPYKRPLQVHGLRMIELTQRTSTVMKVTEVDEFTDRDPVLNVFRTFGRLNHISVSAGISIAPEDSFAEVLTAKAHDRGSELLLVPWSETGVVSDLTDNQTGAIENTFTSSNHNQFISQVLDAATCNTAILVNRGLGGLERSFGRRSSVHSFRSRRNAHVHEAPVAPVADPSHHIFFPFFGGEDDKLALRFVLQLASNVRVTATIVHVVYRKDARVKVPQITRPPASLRSDSSRRDLPRGLSLSNVPTLSSLETPHAAEQPTNIDDPYFQSMSESIPIGMIDRVVFERVETSQPLQYSLNRAREELGTFNRNAGDLLVLGRAGRETRPHIRAGLVEVLNQLELPSGAGAEMRKCLGDMAEAAIVAGVKASVLVLQAGQKRVREVSGGLNVRVREIEVAGDEPGPSTGSSTGPVSPSEADKELR